MSNNKTSVHAIAFDFVGVLFDFRAGDYTPRQLAIASDFGRFVTDEEHIAYYSKKYATPPDQIVEELRYICSHAYKIREPDILEKIPGSNSPLPVITFPLPWTGSAHNPFRSSSKSFSLLVHSVWQNPTHAFSVLCVKPWTRSPKMYSLSMTPCDISWRLKTVACKPCISIPRRYFQKK